MKKLILTHLLVLTSVVVFSQTQFDKSQFKDYKSCQSCFDNWKKDNGDLTNLKSQLNRPAQNSGRQMKQGVKRTLSFLITSTIAVAGIVAYDKIYNGMSGVNMNTNLR